MRNFKNGRRWNSLSVYLFKSQCSCATIGPTGLQVFNNVTNRHLSRTYHHRMKEVSNVNCSARIVSSDGRSTHHVLFHTLATIYMECREGNLYGIPRRRKWFIP